MELPPDQSYGYQRECMTFNYPTKPEPAEKCEEIDEVTSCQNKRKEHTAEDEEIMYVKVDPKCFETTEDGSLPSNHQTAIKLEPESVKNFVTEETGLSNQVTRQDQHSYAKIETLRGKTPTEIHGQLKEVCGNSAVDRSTVSRWAQRFRESCRSILDVSRSDRPKITTENMSADIIATILDEDRRITAEEEAGLIPPQELAGGSCKPQHPPPPHAPPPSRLPSDMEPSQSTAPMDSKDSERKLLPQEPTEWCQKIDAEDIAHFLDVDIAMKETEMKYSTALGTIDQKVLNCLRQKTSPGCKENYSNTGERRLFTQHAYVQTSEKPFPCGVCGKYFNQASHLQQHMRTHTGERPFSCTLCSGTFTRMSDLKRHMRTHTGEKPYKCPVCSNMFGDVSHLKTHMRTHTGEKPFSCTICSKAFARQSSLKRHMRVHNRD